MTHYIKGKSPPLVAMDDLNEQVPGLKKKFCDCNAYTDASINDILNQEQLRNAPESRVDFFETSCLEDTGNGFTMHMLPMQTQYSPVCAMIAADMNKYGRNDIVLSGNNIYNRIYLARHDANDSMSLVNEGGNNFYLFA